MLFAVGKTSRLDCQDHVDWVTVGSRQYNNGQSVGIYLVSVYTKGSYSNEGHELRDFVWWPASRRGVALRVSG